MNSNTGKLQRKAKPCWGINQRPALVPVIPIQAGTGRSHGKAQVFLIKPRRERGAAKNTPKMDLNSSAALPSTGIDALPVVQNL